MSEETKHTEEKKAPSAAELATQLAELRKEKQQKCQQELSKLVESWGDFVLMAYPVFNDNGTIGARIGIAPKMGE